MRLAIDFENTDGVGTLLESLSLEICLFPLYVMWKRSHIGLINALYSLVKIFRLFDFFFFFLGGAGVGVGEAY